MSSSWVAALGFSVAGSLGGLLAASLLLLFNQNLRTRFVPWFVSFAVGTLLGAALLDLLPEALEALPPPPVFGTLLAGILTFFVLEKLVLWRHCHDDEDCEIHSSTVSMIFVGDALHTFVDGIAIAAATLVSIPLGATTALAVAAHEIPQEVGDFAVLLSAGQSRSRALLLNLAAGGAGLVGAAGMLAFGTMTPAAVPYVHAFAAGNFMYVAMSDLIPNLHRGTIDSNAVRQVLLIGLGVLTMILI